MYSTLVIWGIRLTVSFTNPTKHFLGTTYISLATIYFPNMTPLKAFGHALLVHILNHFSNQQSLVFCHHYLQCTGWSIWIGPILNPLKFKKKKIIIPNIIMCTFFHHKNDGGKCLAPKWSSLKIYSVHIGHSVRVSIGTGSFFILKHFNVGHGLGL